MTHKELVEKLMEIIQECEYELWCEMKSTVSQEEFDTDYNYVDIAMELLKEYKKS